MVRLDPKSLKSREEWKRAGITLPSFNYEELCVETKKHPVWAHMGPGNIFRAFIAELAQRLIEKGDMKSGVTVISTLDQQIISKIYEPCGNLALCVTMHADGSLDKKVIASVGQVLRTDKNYMDEWEDTKRLFASPSLQMLSFTITEKGYNIRGLNGEFTKQAERDFASDPLAEPPATTMAITAALLLARFNAGKLPMAVVSMDNFSRNGDKLFESVRTFAEKWSENGLAPKEFLDYICNPHVVSFPCTMIDKITPRPDAKVAESLKESGFESTETVITDMHTYIAPFVNTEAPQYLVVEDNFPNGRPPLEKAGVYMTDKRTVDLAERMKVCTCLNPLHTSLAVFGCLLGYKSIAAEMKDRSLVNLVNRLGYKEGLPVVANPGILSPELFLKEFIGQRLPNPYIPDTPQRIATDTSQKLPIRFGETIKLYRASDKLDVRSLKCIPLAIAAWCRYLMGIDDSGAKMELSPDPMLGELCGYLKNVKLGSAEGASEALRPILSNKRIFGSDLYEVGLAGKVEEYFKEMTEGPGAVRSVLDREMGGADA